LCGFGSFAPVRAAVEAPPAPSRHHVVRQRGTVQRDNKAPKRNIKRYERDAKKV